jgi:3-phosphoshikimate 1-carboxyvinyltransferase
MEVTTVRMAAHPLDAVVEVPGSKSIANRALICAALADGESVLAGVPGGDDSAALLECLALLGVGIEPGVTEPGVAGAGLVGAGVGGAGGAGAGGGGDDSTVRVGGVGRDGLRRGPLTLPARLAGTTSRFVTALAALGPGPYTVDGLPPLRGRPMAPLHDALAALGANVDPGEAWGHLPVTITGGVRNGGELAMPGDVSSQVLSALMMIGPCLTGGLTIRLTTALVSRPYLAITAAVMAAFGATDVHVGERELRVGPGAYVARRFTIEPDASSASYPLAAAALRGGRVRVPGLTDASIQGDATFADLLAAMGCAATRDGEATTVERTGDLAGIDVDLADRSDLVPTLAVVATAATTPTEIRGIGFIRGKESDRIGDLCAELRRAGVDAVELDDGLRIEPGPVRPARLGTHHDHRLAMSFAVLGLANAGIEIEDPEVVVKSWPGFWSMLAGLG